jgi:hypothetical protein
MATRYQKFIGGLLGEDVEGMSEEERKQLSRQGTTSAVLGLLGGKGLLGGLGAYGEQREEKRKKAREEEAAAMQRQIQVAIGSQLGEGQGMSPNLMNILSTPEGAAAAEANPMLKKAIEDRLGRQVVGGSLYDRATGQFIQPPAERARTLTPAEISKEGLPRGTVAQYDEKGGIKIIYEPKIAATGIAKDPQDLRKEVNAQLKPYAEVGDMWAKVRQAGQNPTAANDLALIFGYMKILDPGSVVREGEFANAQNSAGVPDRLRATYNNLLRGERLTEVQRQDFLRSAYGAVQSQVPRVQSVVDYYTNVASAVGVKPEAIIRNPLKDAIVPKVTNDADYAKLAPGTLFEDPNGNLRTKPRNK